VDLRSEVDGYRGLILKQPARVYMRSRNDKGLTERTEAFGGSSRAAEGG